MRTAVGFGVAALLAGCGDGGESVQRNDPQIAVRSAEQDRLHQLDEMGRHIGLKRAILDSGLRCQRVTESGYVQEYNRLSMWTATCDDGRSWAIFVGADGSGQVRPCGDMEQLELPRCRIAADPTGRAARAAARSGAQGNTQ